MDVMGSIWQSYNQPSGFPGQPGNPVGFAAAPGFTALSAPVSIGTTLILTNGSPGSPNIVQFKDIVPQGGGITNNVINSNGVPSNGSGGVAVHDITFRGCRFSAQTTDQPAMVDLYTCGSTNITFEYCTIAPPVALSPHPIPALVWPSSSVGQGPGAFNSSVYMTPWLNSARDCITVGASPGSLIRLDHCDIWGCSELVEISGNPWTGANNSISGVNGTIQIVDCWLHDNKLPTAVPWSSGTNYSVIGTYVSGLTAFNNFKSIATSGPGFGGAVDPESGGGGGNASWAFFTTFDHGNGVQCSNSAGCSNVLVDHCTISGLGNTDNICFAHLQTVGTFWQAGTTYTTEGVGASDGFFYAAIGGGSTGVNPAGNTHTTVWSQFGFNGLQNITVRRCWIDGFNDGIDMGIGNSGQTGMTFEDNIISNDVMWLTFLCQVTGASNAGPYSPNMSGMFTAAPANSWRRNTYNVYSGSASYDPTRQALGGYFLWPDGTLNLTDWPN